ncbi:hypothetical protein PSQ19_17450 [Devosia algicola]|uniref:Uncharacterized protein n=1 Tax=Devosia algicola TaxID=3026418 RepID=A0ABY7YM49_9HYPH|nr:hypothetical protein [Devosia algicola]WDR02376.1 hypothetical protein PSQ19_17450 [Devosia algicola]
MVTEHALIYFKGVILAKQAQDMDHEAEALRLVFMEKMLETAVSKAEVLRRLENAPPHHLDRIYTALHQVRKVRRKLIAFYRRMEPPKGEGDEFEPVS